MQMMMPSRKAIARQPSLGIQARMWVLGHAQETGPLAGHLQLLPMSPAQAHCLSLVLQTRILTVERKLMKGFRRW